MDCIAYRLLKWVVSANEIAGAGGRTGGLVKVEEVRDVRYLSRYAFRAIQPAVRTYLLLHSAHKQSTLLEISTNIGDSACWIGSITKRRARNAAQRSVDNLPVLISYVYFELLLKFS